ncbi:head maturation protease, ClpP-related [Corynebacterium coyleae]|uniref:head maturation protease, ClpP-related n=1 Tax=Corynebacterium coyleae TaxID=53374 RepID=UPI00254B039F|nr:head maturation protease, ClpP-related [Corynebacterium coyleae]MDK8242577.1 Clp protease ClpP [Corynebacterium coyleae]
MNEILMYGNVGWDITAAETIAKLAEVTGDVTVRINSYGGDSFEGVAVMNALRHHDGQVTVIVDGVAASAASIIAVGGADRLVMRPGSELMIHDAWTFADGNAADLTKVAGDLERTSQSMSEIYADKGGGEPDVWRDMMRAETWFSAQEAVDAGLADAVEDGRAVEKPVLAKSGPRFAYAGRERAPKPKIFEEENMAFTHEVAKRLGLSVADVDEATVLEALEETLAEQADTEDSEPEGEQVAGDTAKEQADADQADADAAVEVDGDEEPAEFAEEPAEDPDDPETVTLDIDTYRELQAAAKAGWEAAEANKQRDLEGEVEQWIKDGRISAALRGRAVKAIKADAAGARALYGSNPKGTIPRAEVGYGVDPVDAEVEQTKDQKVQAAISRANERAQARK